MGAMSLAVTVGSSSAGTASLIMNIVLLVGVVVSGGLRQCISACLLHPAHCCMHARHSMNTRMRCPAVAVSICCLGLHHSHAEGMAPWICRLVLLVILAVCTERRPPPLCRHAGQSREYDALDLPPGALVNFSSIVPNDRLPLCAGMLVNPESMEPWIRWTHYISIFFYSYSAMMVSLLFGV